jgi:antibiotic biosynthesis monooxygenase (ABM) superfamily enzyme
VIFSANFPNARLKVQPPYAENRTYGGVGGTAGAIPQSRPDHGLEAFFRQNSPALPPTWKMAITTYLGVVPVIMFLALTLGRLLQNWNFVLNNIVFNAFVVALLTWVVMPLITRALQGWLHSE